MISIIMPAYNVENYIAMSIQSVLNQTYQNWELIIINDGSTDSTLQIINRFLEDKRIKLINKANQGVSIARNVGIEMALGQYICFLDSDDLWENSFLEKLLNCLKEKNAYFVFSLFDNLLENNSYKEHKVPKVSGNIINFINKSNLILPMHIGSIMVSKNLLNDNKLKFDEKTSFNEDGEFLFKVITLTDAVFIDQILMHYRWRSGSVMRQKWDWHFFVQSFLTYERIVGFIQQNYTKDNKEKVLKAFQASVSFRKYRFIIELIKHGYKQIAREYVIKWKSELEKFADNTNFHLKDRIRCKLLINNNELVWRLL